MTRIKWATKFAKSVIGADYNKPRKLPVRVSHVRVPQGRSYDEVSVGDEFDYVLTITETHLVKRKLGTK